MEKRKRSKTPANATAWCALHRRMMNDVYIRRRGCAMRRCKHLNWLGIDQPKNESEVKNGDKTS